MLPGVFGIFLEFWGGLGTGTVSGLGAGLGLLFGFRV